MCYCTWSQQRRQWVHALRASARSALRGGYPLTERRISLEDALQPGVELEADAWDALHARPATSVGMTAAQVSRERHKKCPARLLV